MQHTALKPMYGLMYNPYLKLPKPTFLVGSYYRPLYGINRDRTKKVGFARLRYRSIFRNPKEVVGGGLMVLARISSSAGAKLPKLK